MIKYFVAAFILLSATFAVAQASQGGVNIFEEPRELPTREFMRSDGTFVKLTDFKDEFVIALFWSRHCGPCLSELNTLQIFADKTHADSIKLLLTSPSNEWKSVDEQKEFLARFGVNNLEFYIDKASNLAADFGIFTSPNAVLINRAGQEIGRLRGSADWSDERVIEYIYKIKALHG